LDPGTGTAGDGCARFIRPDGAMEELELPLPADGGSETRRPYQIAEPHGIWRIDSYLRDGNGRAAGPIVTSWFVVGRAPAPPEADDLYCTVTLPGTYLVRGSIVPVMVRLWNDGEKTSEITYRGPAGKNTVKLAPGQARTIREEINLDKMGTTLVYEFYGPTGERLATVRRRLQVGEPDRVFASISPARKEAAAGQVVTLSLSILSVNPGTYQADCWLRLVHNGKILWQEPRQLELAGAYSRTETIKVPLPPGESGRLVLEATLAYEGHELARAWTELTIKQ
ncbi:MAG: hypothetical protein K6U03_05555, partial [Firmicutes bacterium]|nr:hypothetical protein [Bacillota bacterium]